MCIYAVGHGKSQGDKVHVESFNIYIQDVAHHIEDMRAQYPGVPSLLMGHSMVRNTVLWHYCINSAFMYI